MVILLQGTFTPLVHDHAGRTQSLREFSTELGVVYKNVTVDEFSVKRNVDSFTVKFSFFTQTENVHVVLFGVRDSDDLCEILSADRLWVEESNCNQAEFGGFILGVSHEHYTEITFDRLGEKGL